MSYCRWSLNGFQCDVYVADAPDGYVTQLERMRRPRRVPDFDPFTYQTFTAAWRAHRAALADPTNQPQPIGLPEDGATFIHETPRECAENLIRLRDLGYLVPQEAIDELLEEAGETPMCDEQPRYVRHISGQGKKWKVRYEYNYQWSAKAEQEPQPCQYLPKSEYIVCDPPELEE